MDDNPYESPRTEDTEPWRWKRPTLTTMALIVLAVGLWFINPAIALFVIPTLLAVILPIKKAEYASNGCLLAIAVVIAFVGVCSVGATLSGPLLPKGLAALGLGAGLASFVAIVILRRFSRLQ